jgi:prevent-host-death family protein
MNYVTDIRPLSDFKRNTGEILEHLRASGRPVVLTINGKAEMVVQDAESYQKMLDQIDRMEANEGIRRGLEDVEHGRVRPARESFAALRKELGVRG